MAARSSLLWGALPLWFLMVCTAAVTAQQDGLPPQSTQPPLQAVLTLRTLDKITARTGELKVPVGGVAQFGTLAIEAVYCRSRPPIEPPETFAYLRIREVTTSGDAAPSSAGGETEPQPSVPALFEGWMFASSPALNPLEHPVYDVWVISCSTSAAPAETGSR